MFGLGMLKGLGVTLRHFVESYRYDRKPWEDRYGAEWVARRQSADMKGLVTIQYPEQRRKIPENFRFIPMLVYEETPESPRCTACGICARVCPPQCIWIRRATDDKGRPKAQPAGFWIDATICMSCGSCSEYCPFDAIKMNQVHEIATLDRDRDLFFDMKKLLVPLEYYAQLHPTDYAAEEAARQAKEEAKQKAGEAKAAEATRQPAAPAKEAAAPTEDSVASAGTAAALRKEAASPEAPMSADPDDLKRIEGIGPKIAAVLQTAGIVTFAQLADTGVDRIKQILQEADPKLLNLADPTTWPKQARLAATGKWESLQKWQEKLKTGQER